MFEGSRFKVLGAGFLVLAAAASAPAQDRPFLFSVTTAAPESKAVRIDYDVGAGERAFQGDTANQPEQRIGVQATYGRFTVIGRVGLASEGSAYQCSQSGELLVSLLGPASRVALAVGGGVLHEAWSARHVTSRRRERSGSSR